MVKPLRDGRLAAVSTPVWTGPQVVTATSLALLPGLLVGAVGVCWRALRVVGWFRGLLVDPGALLGVLTPRPSSRVFACTGRQLWAAFRVPGAGAARPGGVMEQRDPSRKAREGISEAQASPTPPQSSPSRSRGPRKGLLVRLLQTSTIPGPLRGSRPPSDGCGRQRHPCGRLQRPVDHFRHWNGH